jgi:cysteinyl-tRNA synthetase
MGVLQVDPEEWFAGHVEGELSAADIGELIAQRKAAREARDFVLADSIRDQLVAAGVQIEDAAGATTWKRIG